MKAIIFDLDQTLVDTDFLEHYRKQRNWGEVYRLIDNNPIKLYDGLNEVFECLHEKKVKIAIVTSSPRPYASRIIEKAGIRHNVLIAYHDTSRRKPFPDPILKALNELNISNDEYDLIYSLGDKDIDIVASKIAGVNSVACYWGANDKNSLKMSCPKIEIFSPTSILDFIK